MDLMVKMDQQGKVELCDQPVNYVHLLVSPGDFAEDIQYHSWQLLRGVQQMVDAAFVNTLFEAKVRHEDDILLKMLPMYQNQDGDLEKQFQDLVVNVDDRTVLNAIIRENQMANWLFECGSVALISVHHPVTQQVQYMALLTQNDGILVSASTNQPFAGVCLWETQYDDWCISDLVLGEYAVQGQNIGMLEKVHAREFLDRQQKYHNQALDNGVVVLRVV